jgi:hypothetical protein
MTVRKVVAGSVLAAGLGVAGLFGAGAASADVSNNGTTNDAYGYGIANHIANFNGDHNGIGWVRSDRTLQTAEEISGEAGRKKIEDHYGVVSTQGSENDATTNYDPISNNHPTKVGNGRVPGK